MINENFLHFIWKFKLFDCSNLQATNQAEIQILQQGLHNHNAGPDFLNARIKIQDLVWCGDVEIHVNSSDWYLHQHQLDDNYATVILHVVYENNQEIVTSRGEPLICLELKNRIPETYIEEYQTLYQSVSNLPCSYAIGNLSNMFWESYAERLLIEKLEIKMTSVRQIFLDANKNYQECFYQLLAYSLGLKINANTMLNLAKISPLLLLQKHGDNRLQTEAILYGQSGLLEQNHKSDYAKKLKNEYVFLAQKYKLRSMTPVQWKFFRLRPSSFPTLRISYLADFISNSSAIFEQLFNFKSVKSISFFFDLKVSDYWNSHYVFDKKSKTANKKMGKATLGLILINAILPFCFFYARQKSDHEMMMRVVDSYRELKYEDNKIIRYYIAAAVEVKTALKSQALIHLHQEYCIPRKCLNCRVFNQILK